MAKYRKQHFIPKTYLEPWSSGPEKQRTVYILNHQGRPYKTATKNVGYKKNLYTIKSLAIKDDKAVELILGIWEGRWNKVRDEIVHNKRFIKPKEIKYFISYMLVQSIRTIKAKEESQEVIDSVGSDKLKSMVFAEICGLLSIRIIEIVDRCSVVLFTSDLLNRFITSDNPSTHWFDKGPFYQPVEAIKYMQASHFSNFLVQCPITPNCIAQIRVNNTPLAITRLYADKGQVRQFNLCTEMRANKFLYAKSLNDFTLK